MSEPQPRLRPTEPATLVVAGLAAAAIGWLLISHFYGSMPRLTWLPVIVIAGLALLEAAVAQDTWARVHQRGWGPALARFQRGSAATRPPVDPLVVARFVVLAKASSLAGAIFAGGYGGFLSWLLIESRRLTQAAIDLPPAISGLVASSALMGAALWLEWACRVPKSPDDDEDEHGGDSS